MVLSEDAAVLGLVVGSSLLRLFYHLEMDIAGVNTLSLADHARSLDALTLGHGKTVHYRTLAHTRPDLIRVILQVVYLLIATAVDEREDARERVQGGSLLLVLLGLSQYSCLVVHVAARSLVRFTMLSSALGEYRHAIPRTTAGAL